jgi:dTDP-4-amino-4,6-dideoxygalactose transaminase
MEQKLTGARLGLKPDKTLPDFYFEQFTQLQATAGLALLETVSDGDAKRIANVEEIRQALTDFERPFPRKLDGARNVYWQFVIYPPDEATTRKMLAKNGIDTATTNLSLISELGIYGECEVDCPNAEYVKHHGFFVPGYGRLSRRDVARIKRVLRNVFAQADQTSASAAPVA